eukprot:6455580-Karenia_brevis.AAC.3
MASRPLAQLGAEMVPRPFMLEPKNVKTEAKISSPDPEIHFAEPTYPTRGGVAAGAKPIF